MNFLADQYAAGLQYSTLNGYRSALSSTLPRRDGQLLGQQEDVCRVMRGVYNLRPPLPRYVSTWNVANVLEVLRSWDNAQLSLYSLSVKLVLLLALAKAPRAKELCLLSHHGSQCLPDGVVLQLTAPTKTQHAGRMKQFFIPVFADKSLCPVACLNVYLARTSPLRPKPEASNLFISSQKPHHPVAVSTISRWLKHGLSKCGVDTSQYSGHSVRGASATAAREAGVSMEVVMASADWASPHTFISHYYRPHALASFGNAVLASSQA